MVANEVGPTGQSVSDSDESGKSRRKLWTRRGITVLFAGLVVYIGYRVGIFVFDQYPFDPKSLAGGSVLATGGAMIATLKEILSMGSDIKKLWNEGIGGYKLATFLLLLAMGITLSWKAMTEPGDIGRKSGAGTPVMFVYPSEPSFSIPFRDEASECATGRTECDDDRIRKGSTVLPDVRILFELLARGLTACSRSDSSIVEVEITGYASSSPFVGKSTRDSRRLNVDIANARAVAVKRQLLRELRSRDNLIRTDGPNALPDDSAAVINLRGHNIRLRVITRQWELFEDMIKAGKYNDLDERRKYDADRGVLNRRASVRVVRLGNCQLQYP